MSMPHRFVSGAIDLSEVKARAESSGSAVTLTVDNVEQELIRRSAEVPVVVLIGTPRSPDSEQLRADLSQLADENGGFVFRYIDADSTPEVAGMFGIQGLPTVVAMHDAKPLANFEGGQPIEALRQWTAAVVKAVGGEAGSGEEEDPRLEGATAALNEGDFDKAIEIYEGILASEPKNTMVAQARDTARLLKRLKGRDATVDPIAAADADPENLELAFAAADAAIAAGQPEAAFDRLIAHLSRPGSDKGDKEAAKARLLELFALFDATDPRVIAARGRLASALF